MDIGPSRVERLNNTHFWGAWNEFQVLNDLWSLFPARFLEQIILSYHNHGLSLPTILYTNHGTHITATLTSSSDSLTGRTAANLRLWQQKRLILRLPCVSVIRIPITQAVLTRRLFCVKPSFSKIKLPDWKQLRQEAARSLYDFKIPHSRTSQHSKKRLLRLYAIYILQRRNGTIRREKFY